MKKHLDFQYSCVTCSDVEELEGIIDRSEDITHDEFKDAIGEEAYYHLTNVFGYPIAEDWHVTYHRSTLENGTTVVYVCHSAIEYVYYNK